MSRDLQSHHIMKPPYQKYLQEMDLRTGASDDALRKLAERSGITFPDDYLSFLRETNGIEGKMGSSYVVFWPVDDLIDNNRGTAIYKYLPGIFLIGSDGGGEAFGIDFRSQELLLAIPWASNSANIFW